MIITLVEGVEGKNENQTVLFLPFVKTRSFTTSSTVVQLIIFSGPSGEPVRHSLGQPPCAHHKHLDKSLASAGLDEVTTHLIL